MPVSTDNPVDTLISSSFNPPKMKSMSEDQINPQIVGKSPIPPMKEEQEEQEAQKMDNRYIPFCQKMDNRYIPLWMPILAFALIIAAYLCCYVVDIEVNPLYKIGAIGISMFFGVACAYLKYKEDFQ